MVMTVTSSCQDVPKSVQNAAMLPERSIAFLANCPCSVPWLKWVSHPPDSANPISNPTSALISWAELPEELPSDEFGYTAPLSGLYFWCRSFQHPYGLKSFLYRYSYRVMWLLGRTGLRNSGADIRHRSPFCFVWQKSSRLLMASDWFSP